MTSPARHHQPDGPRSRSSTTAPARQECADRPRRPVLGGGRGEAWSLAKTRDDRSSTRQGSGPGICLPRPAPHRCFRQGTATPSGTPATRPVSLDTARWSRRRRTAAIAARAFAHPRHLRDQADSIGIVHGGSPT